MLRNKVVLAAGVVVVGLMGPVLPQASAAQVDVWDCPDGHMCFYSEPGFQGELTHLEPIDAHFCGPVTGSPARSVVNLSETAWTVFTGPDCDGEGADIEPDEFISFVPEGVRSWY